MIKYDNTALQRQAIQSFEEGERKFNQGASLKEKEQGIQSMI